MGSTRKKGMICILFDEVPEGTHYRSGSYSWVNEKEAEQYIAAGIANEYDPIQTAERQFEVNKPTKSNTVKEIKEWLNQHGVPYSDENKSELLKLVENAEY